MAQEIKVNNAANVVSMLTSTLSLKPSPVVTYPLQTRPIKWCAGDRLFATSQQEAITLLRSRWHALLDDNGMCLKPPTLNRFYKQGLRANGQTPAFVDFQVPPYKPGLVQCFTFYRLIVNQKREGNDNYIQGQVYICYVAPGTRYTTLSPQLHLYYSEETGSHLWTPKQLPGVALIASRL